MNASSRNVLVLVNPKSGLRWSFEKVREALDRYWDCEGTTLTYQFCQSPVDGVQKASRAAAAGVDTILVAGGDGTVNSVARELVGKAVTLGIIPVGSGNGFARHFEIPLSPEKAVKALATAAVRAIDVGLVDGNPFLVTCSMAWEAAIAKNFARSPIRGVIPYVFAGVQELFDYQRQDIEVVLDHGEHITFERPLVFTVANLSQYGGGAKIAPQAMPDDGYLELVVVRHQNIPKFIANIGRLFDGSLDRLPEVSTFRFQHLSIRRAEATSIQVDGELVDAGSGIEVTVLPAALRVLVPEGTGA